MATNTTVLLIVVAMAALVLACVLTGVVYHTRGFNRSEPLHDQADEDARQLRQLKHEEVLADELDATAHAARVEIGIKTYRARRLQKEATAHRDAASTIREQLNGLEEAANKPTAAGQP